MTKFKRLAGIFACLLLLQILLSECDTHERYEYIVSDFQMTDYAFSQAIEPWINYKIEDDSIDANSYYGFSVELITDIINTVDISQLRIPWIQHAYATAKSTEDYVLMNEMKEISIITKFDFDSLHPAHSNIEDLFNIYDWTLNDSIISLEEGFIPYYEDYNGRQNPYYRTDLKVLLTSIPQNSNKMQFEVQIHFADNTTLVRETPLIWQK